MQIVVTYDASADNAPAGFKAAVQAAVQYLESQISSPVGISINVGWGEVGGQALDSGALAESDATLVTPNYGVPVFTGSSPADVQARFVFQGATIPEIEWIPLAEANALGVVPQQTGVSDGDIGLSSSVTWTFDPNNRAVPGAYDAIGAIEHEITEVMGRQLWEGQEPGFDHQYQILDVYRYTAPGVLATQAGPGYFSLNGQQMLLPLNDPSNGGDAGDWASSVTGDAFGAFGQTGVEASISPVDLRMLEAIGYPLSIGAPTPNGVPVGPLYITSAVTVASGQTQTFNGPIAIYMAQADSTPAIAPSLTNSGTIVDTGADSQTDVRGVSYAQTNQVLAGSVFTNAASGSLSVTATVIAADAVGVYWGPSVVNNGLIQVTSDMADAWGVIGDPYTSAATGALSVQAANAAVGVNLVWSSGGAISNAGAINVGGLVAIGVEGMTSLENTGLIIAKGAGAGSSGTAVETQAGSSVTVDNSGTLEGDDAIFANGGNVALTNSGTIIGQIVLQNATGQIQNSGSIAGAIHFGDGYNVYNGAAGHQSGGIYLGHGSNTVTLGGDGEAVYGGGGADTITGGAGADFVELFRGTNSIDGGGGFNTLSFADSDLGITVDLGAGAATNAVQSDTIKNIQEVIGSNSNNILIAGSAAATLVAGSAHDVLTGGAGGDTLVAGAGGDTMSGGGGANTFIYAAGDHQLVITDFSAAGASNVLDVYGYASAQSVQQQGANTLITLSNTDSILLDNVLASSLAGGALNYNANTYAPPVTPPSAPLFGTKTVTFIGSLTIVAAETFNIVNQAVALQAEGLSLPQANDRSLDNFGVVNISNDAGDASGLVTDHSGNSTSPNIIVNEAGAILSATDTSVNGAAFGMNLGYAPAIENAGLIQAGAIGDAYGVSFDQTPSLTNTTSGVIQAQSTSGTAVGLALPGGSNTYIFGVLVNQGTIIASGASSAYGVQEEQSYGGRITNSGVITAHATAADGRSYGVAISGFADSLLSPEPVEFQNSGTLTADTAILLSQYEAAVPSLSLTNSGSITGVIDLSAGAGIDQIVNTGAITGAIEFGDGPTTYNGACGTQSGGVYLGRGVASVALGDDGESVFADDGSGTITGGAGGDFFELVGGDYAVDGGGGSNTLSFADSQAGVIVNLAAGFAQATGVDTIKNIQTVIGSGFNDTLIAGTASATLIGGGGFDTLVGGAGGDTLVASGAGSVMTGGGGNNTFVYQAGDHQAVITDFDRNGDHDTLKVFGYAAAQSVTQVGADTLIALSGGDSILLKNVLATSLSGVTFSPGAYAGPVVPSSPVVGVPADTAMKAASFYSASASQAFNIEAVNSPGIGAPGQLGGIWVQDSDTADIYALNNFGAISIFAQSGALAGVICQPYPYTAGHPLNGTIGNRTGALLRVTNSGGSAVGVSGPIAADIYNQGWFEVTASGSATGVSIGTATEQGEALDNDASGVFTVTSSTADATGVLVQVAGTVENDGQFSVVGATTASGFVFQNGTSVINKGVLDVTSLDPNAATYGIVINDTDNQPAQSFISNDGTITAKTAILELNGGGGFNPLRIINRGTINGDINLAGGATNFLNLGTINGRLLMTDGANTIDMRGGGAINSAIEIAPTSTGTVSDTIFTGSGATLITIASGDPNLTVAVTGGAGGQTTVQFDEVLALASFTQNADGSWKVAAGADGTETLTNVQAVVFTDKTVNLAQPVSAGAALSATAVNGARTVVSDSLIAGAVIDITSNALTVTGASLSAASVGAGGVSLDNVKQAVTFTPAAGFAGTAVVNVTVTDGNGVTVQQAVNINVVVQASAPVVTPPNTVTTTVSGNFTTLRTVSPTGTLISTETILVTGGTTQTQYFNAAGAQTAATISQVTGNVTELQTFDGAWRQQSATITTDNGGGDSVVQSFDGAWTQTGATVTTVTGATTIVQTFNPSWAQQSATVTTVNGAVTETQNFDAHWNQTSANLTTTLGGGVVESQNFNASWVQTGATLTSHPSANQTEVQTFNAAWQQTGATLATVANGQTTTQSFNGSWLFQGATIDTPNPDAALSDRLDTYGANWNPLSEVDTLLNGGQSFFAYGVGGGGQAFTAAAGHSTTFVFTPGQVAGDTISGLHTNNLGGAIHDVIDFEGFGAGAHLVQTDATHWQVVSTNNPTETFTLAGGATLGDGDYAFVAAGSALTSASVGGAGVALFSQFSAAGLGAASDAGAGAAATPSTSPAAVVIAPPSPI